QKAALGPVAVIRPCYRVIAGIAIYGSYDYLYVRPQIAAKEERARRQYETELNRHRAIEQRLQTRQSRYRYH
ncbi:beta-lactamase class C-like penicillin binding protein, partial [Lacticaseibacillus rhamnosus MTCC 5462]